MMRDAFMIRPRRSLAPYTFGQVPQQLLSGDANTIIQP